MTSLVKLRDKNITKILAFDLEWSLDKDNDGECRILAAGFCDSAGYREAYLLEDDDLFDKKSKWSKDRAEKLLLSRIIKVINRYDWSVGFYSTGIRAYSAVKDKVVGRDSDRNSVT